VSFGLGKCHARTTAWRILHVFKPKTLFDGLFNPKKWEYPEITTGASTGDLEARVSVRLREQRRLEERYYQLLLSIDSVRKS
jgi:hypothetical protein